jgi:uncharacterized protein YijF (DUF1287 family)
MLLPLALIVAAGLHDRGIFSDLDSQVQVTLPPHLEPSALLARYDRRAGVLVLFDGDQPLKAYPVASRPRLPGATELPAIAAALLPGDAAELGGLPGLRVLDAHTPGLPAVADSDGDGIPDRLDALLGARKLVLNGAAYTEGYFRIAFPGGDVSRDKGVCTDTVIRSLRNAGLDLQRLVAEDLRAAPRAYPMVRRPDPNIDHRRVRVLARWFERHYQALPASEPRRAGDVVFLDTIPAKPGPDHVGIISDRLAASGQPYVINNWDVGSVEGELDLLPVVPVTHHYRLR